MVSFEKVKGQIKSTLAVTRDEYLEVDNGGYPSVSDIGRTFTMEGLINIQKFRSNPDDPGEAGISTFMGTEGKTLLRFGDSGVEPDHLQANGQDIGVKFKTNQWYHIALVVDGSKTTAYVNGKKITEFKGSRMKKITFAVFVVVAFLASGCSKKTNSPRQDIVIQKVDKDDIRDVIRQEKMIFDAEPAEAVFSAVGEGIAPMNTASHAQSLALAKRAAIADGHRQLAEKLYGVKINSRDTVRDAMLKDSTITTQVAGLIKNASIVEHDFKDGLYRVRMEMKIDQNKWQEIFAY